MPEVVIPTGQSRDGWIVLSVNGNVQWVKAGVPTTELDATELEVLGHAMINYNIIDGDGNEVAPLIFADFKNGVYTVDGDTVAISDLLEESESYTGWNPSLVSAGVGLDCTSEETNFRLKKALFSGLGAGSTILPTVKGDGVFYVRMTDDPTWNNMFPMSLGILDQSGTVSIDDGTGSPVTDDAFDSATFRVALNATLTRLAASINGRTPITFDVTYDASAHPFDTSIVTVGMGQILESIGWYPLQDEADLSTLSALS